MNFQLSPERIERLKQQKAFADLAVSKKKKAEEQQAEEKEGRRLQEAILAMLLNPPDTLFYNNLADTLFKNRPDFEQILDDIIRASTLPITPPLRKAIMTALSERDETAEICRDKHGNPEPDSELRDSENVPLVEGEEEVSYDFYSERVPLLESIDSYFKREVLPYIPDAWISKDFRDEKDGRIGKVGYEINFNRCFYKYQPPRPLEEIDVDIKLLEQDVNLGISLVEF